MIIKCGDYFSNFYYTNLNFEKLIEIKKKPVVTYSYLIAKIQFENQFEDGIHADFWISILLFFVKISSPFNKLFISYLINCIGFNLFELYFSQWYKPCFVYTSVLLESPSKLKYQNISKFPVGGLSLIRLVYKRDKIVNRNILCHCTVPNPLVLWL